MPKMLKKALSILLCFAMVAMLPVGEAEAAEVAGHIQVVGFDANVDYSARMRKCAQDGSTYAMEMGWIYEQQRNLKIETLKMPYEKSSYFSDYTTGAEVLAAMDRPKKVARMKKEYPVAGQVYEILNAQGYTDTVIAGILGNMMAECGGQTLNLQWWLYAYADGMAYYGLCQWGARWGNNASVHGADVQGQLDFLMSTIVGNMAGFGGDHTYFCSITDAAEAARYFNDRYERGAGSWQRAKNAQAALAWIQK